MDDTSLKKTPNDHTIIKEQVFLFLLWALFFFSFIPFALTASSVGISWYKYIHIVTCFWGKCIVWKFWNFLFHLIGYLIMSRKLSDLFNRIYLKVQDNVKLLFNHESCVQGNNYFIGQYWGEHGASCYLSTV